MDSIMEMQGFIRLPAREGFPLRIGTVLVKTIGWVARTLIVAFDAIGEARERAYERRLLAEMDSRTCHDIGLTPRESPFAKSDSAVHDLFRGGTGFL
jgi:uncharacterized protein YjiS (DUF1127 family)